ncbi:hypothetical protein F5Y14DRAFT_452151 [Nemania sp. NC0429]|nr:hypothetical protein F5Y14DRAFT_452151 [Nemania sp. NC0429]
MARALPASHSDSAPPQLSPLHIITSTASPSTSQTAEASPIAIPDRGRHLAVTSTSFVDTGIAPSTRLSSTASQSTRDRSTRSASLQSLSSSNSSPLLSPQPSPTMSFTTLPCEALVTPPMSPALQPSPVSSFYSFPFTPPASPSLPPDESDPEIDSDFDLDIVPPPPPPSSPTGSIRSGRQLPRLSGLFSLWRRG